MITFQHSYFFWGFPKFFTGWEKNKPCQPWSQREAICSYYLNVFIRQREKIHFKLCNSHVPNIYKFLWPEISFISHLIFLQTLTKFILIAIYWTTSISWYVVLQRKFIIYVFALSGLRIADVMRHIATRSYWVIFLLMTKEEAKLITLHCKQKMYKPLKLYRF